ncbi:MAG TPA: triose-phosphate isomerase [Pseudomonadales bacterium]|nr:triose-phosphate isomerase [Pseudomonadales bacterium]
MRRPLVAGNWKMNGSSQLVKAWVAAFVQQQLPTGPEYLLCPPYVYLPHLQAETRSFNVSLGAQDVSEHASGAFTGEVSAEMLTDIGCQYVIVGHSERRSLYGDTDERVAKKALAALAKGLVPVVCVGESLEERETSQTEAVVERQLLAVTALLGSKIDQMVIAYEPVWAIGTGKTASPEQAQDVHRFIREQIKKIDAEVASKLRILYGGSVKANNAKALFAQDDIDGGLIGGASLDPLEFAQICAAAG